MISLDNLQIAVSVRQTSVERPNELARTMAPHPLIHQELPFDPTYFVYNRRLATASLNNLSADEVYWRVRQNVILRHTGELPLEIKVLPGRLRFVADPPPTPR